MTKDMKTEIFTLLQEKNLDLAHVIREYLQSILLEEVKPDANSNAF